MHERVLKTEAVIGYDDDEGRELPERRARGQ